MAQVDDELEELRRRAYGREADIHQDSAALARLQRLEDGLKARVEAAEPADPLLDDLPLDDPPLDGHADEPAAAKIETPRPLNEWIRRLSSLRRSTVLIALGAVALVAIIVVTLTLVQRVQTDPLQTGASQIARLQPDSAYRIPDIFGGPGGKNGNAQAFEKFHGLRVVVTAITQTETSRVTGDCMSIYVDADVTDPSSTSFSGPFFSGCGAGRFPAINQFDLRRQELPVGLHDALAPWTGLQFVYDKRDDEVVVFASK